MKLWLLLVAVLAISAVSVPGVSASQADTLDSGAPTKHCKSSRVAVALSPGAPADAEVQGELCWLGAQRPGTVQLLQHGATYDHTYWQFPYQQPHYSYVNFMLLAGYATFNIDRVGSGSSSHPPSSLVDLHSGAYVAFQLIEKLRSGAIGGAPGFLHVITVGHSVGSAIALIEAANYGKVDAVILSGFSHNIGSGVGDVLQAAYQANLDPKFKDLNFDDGYFTTRPGSRGVFYYLPTANPKVVALDDQLKQTGTFSEIGQMADTLSDVSLSQRIRVPVLEAAGDHDILVCGNGVDCSDPQSLQNHDAAFYAPGVPFKGVIFLATGHDLTLQIPSRIWFHVARAWADRYVGPS